MAQSITDSESKLIESQYNWTEIKSIAKSKGISTSRKKKANLISEIYTAHGRDIFSNVNWDNFESSDDDDDDENANINSDNTQTPESELQIPLHSISLRIFSRTINDEITYATFRRILERVSNDVANDINKILVKYLKAGGAAIAASTTTTEFTVCEKAVTSEKAKISQLPPENDPTYNKKRAALVRNQRMSISDRAVNFLAMINGGGVIIIHDTEMEAKGKKREVNVLYLGTWAMFGNKTNKKNANDMLGVLNTHVVEAQAESINKASKTVSIVSDIKEELKEVERKYERNEISEQEYHKTKSNLLDQQMLRIDGKESNEHKESDEDISMMDDCD